MLDIDKATENVSLWPQLGTWTSVLLKNNNKVYELQNWYYRNV